MRATQPLDARRAREPRKNSAGPEQTTESGTITDGPSGGIVPDDLPLFYSENEAAKLLGIHRTTLRTLAIEGRAPIPPIELTEHKRVYRRIDVERLAGVHE